MSNTITTQQVVNGVNVSEMAKTIDAIGEAPAISEFKFRAENTWKDGGKNQSQISGFYGACEEVKRDRAFVFDADEPPVLLGEDAGANPVEFALHALAACMTTSIVYHAAARGIEIESLSSRLEGDLNLKGFLGIDPATKRGYTEIRVVFDIKTEAGEETLHELYTFSPVYEMINAAVPVKVEFNYV